MQRLFSMFPTGAAGIALVILRLSAAAALLAHGTGQPFFAKSLTPLALVLPAGALCLGLLTPYTTAISCLIEFAVILRFAGHPLFPILISIVNTAALGMLGPGAYSLDARIFGRRVVRFSTSNKSEPS
jgi:hypothetical protein